MQKKIKQKESKDYAIGIDVGSVSVNAIVIDSKQSIITESPYRRHFGQTTKEVNTTLRNLYDILGESNIQSISFTGTHGELLSKKFNVFYEFETISQVIGILHLLPTVRTIISMGGQDSALFQIKHGRNGWELENFSVNGPCASGTGSFIDQQAERLATALYKRDRNFSQRKIDDILTRFIQLGLTSESPADVACRCTVFTKSDMIHLQNKGEKLADIVYGLHMGNARNYMSTLVSNLRLASPIAFIGGLSLNKLQSKAFKCFFPDLVIPPHSTSIGALGVALKAMSLGRRDSLKANAANLPPSNCLTTVPRAPQLTISKTRFPTFKDNRLKPVKKKTRTFVGIDVGSTTTKYAVIDESRTIIAKNYVPTRGKPIEVTQDLLKHLHDEFENYFEILGLATTGSGRQVVGSFLNADLITDEITAHARGAIEIDPGIETILEIGGQDAKYIGIVNSHPLDFDMNKVCAAGTGSFLHELAGKFGINIVGEFQDTAFSSAAPVKLAERCTVFMESDLSSWYQKGVDKKDLVAGLCYAIVHNYLNRVVGRRKIGRRVMFLGGPSLNKAVVAAFENVLNRGLIVPAHREVMGAYGAAICVQEKMSGSSQYVSRFRGLDNAINDRLKYKEKVCRTKPDCHNQCKLKLYNFGGRKAVWGGECGRYEIRLTKSSNAVNGFKLRRQLWEKHLAGAYAVFEGDPLMEIDGRQTVGMQSAMYGQQTAVLWAHFFDHLGFRLVLSPSTTEKISKTGINHAIDGVCYPVKVSHGHVSVINEKTRFLFLPTLIDMPGPNPSEKGCYCPMVRSNSYTVRSSININLQRALTPIIHLKKDLSDLSLEISKQMKLKLGVSTRLIKSALTYALEKQSQFVEDVYRQGEKIISGMNPGNPLVVVTGRPYNLYDDRLNLSLGRNLAKIGISSLPMVFVDARKMSLGHFSKIYWGLGAQILRTAKWITNRSSCFGLHLTNFGCGVDSFIEHFYKHIMKEKPYLILELDEHSAVAGVLTRLEAFKNVMENGMDDLTFSQPSGVKKVGAL